MAINANDLDKQIKDAMKAYHEGDYKNEMEDPKHLRILGDEMKKYFEENMEISYGWAAVLPPPASTPDPVVMFDSTVEFPVFDLTAAIDLGTLALLVQSSMLGGIISHAAGFAVAPGTFVMKAPLVFLQTEDAESALYSCVIAPVCTWALTSLINPIPLPGVHGPYSGATAGMVIL